MRQEQGAETLSEEILTKNISKLTENIMPQIQEILQTASRINISQTCTHHGKTAKNQRLENIERGIKDRLSSKKQ